MGFRPAQESTSSSGFGEEVASQGFPEKGAIALGRKGRIYTEGLGLGHRQEAVAPSPLLLLPAPSSWGPQGSNEVFLGPIGQMPWAPVGGGVWGLIRVPLSLFPTPFFFPQCG